VELLLGLTCIMLILDLYFMYVSSFVVCSMVIDACYLAWIVNNEVLTNVRL
jgi:hypothetical protein